MGGYIRFFDQHPEKTDGEVDRNPLFSNHLNP